MSPETVQDHLDVFAGDAARRVEKGYYRCQGGSLRPNGSLVQALKRRPIIAEIKPRSPSAGQLLRGDAADILEAYVDGGAAAISCLADPDHFGGSPDLVRQAHAHHLPVVWKDFVIHADQLRAAAHNGASAVLLIEALFTSPEDRETLVAAAHGLGLEVLLEVHSADEAERIRGSDADLVGVNARDLRTLHEDPDRALKVIQELAATTDRPLVALSSIHDHQGVREAMDTGAQGVLVGTSLLQDPDPALRLQSLRRPLAKVCGVSTPDAVDQAAAAGADLIGVVTLVPRSPRNVSTGSVPGLIDRIGRRGARSVLVTDCRDHAAVLELVEACHPDFLQLHGAPSKGMQARLDAEGVRILHGVHPDQPMDSAGGVVMDASKGQGKTTDLEAVRQALAGARGRFSLVAGGLDPDNVRDAIRRTGAWGADASSSLESSPGIKDPRRIRAFVEACHDA